jgi:hypothetical protein
MNPAASALQLAKAAKTRLRWIAQSARWALVRDPWRPRIPLRQPPPAAVPVPAGFVTYGPFDETGIPLRDFGGPPGVVYHPLVVIEVATHYLQLFQMTGEDSYRRGLKRLLEWLLEAQDADGYWRYGWPYGGYAGATIDAPWASAVTQGCAAQLLARVPDMLGRARRALLACEIPVAGGGVALELERGTFYEEFPGRPPTHILNGHLRVLQGALAVLERGEDAKIRALLDNGVDALEEVLMDYDTGSWSRYDLLPPLQHAGQRVVIAGGADTTASLEAPIEPLKFEAVKPSRYRMLDGSPLPDGPRWVAAALCWKAGTTLLPASSATLTLRASKEARSAWLTWPENSSFLLPLARTNDGFAVPLGLVGHPTGRSYHRLMTEQLEHLGPLVGRPALLETAARWRGYEERFGALCANVA